MQANTVKFCGKECYKNNPSDQDCQTARLVMLHGIVKKTAERLFYELHEHLLIVRTPKVEATTHIDSMMDHVRTLSNAKTRRTNLSSSLYENT